MTDMFPPDARECLLEIEREIRIRRRVYPDWVAKGRINADTADRRIEVLEAIASRIAKEAGLERMP